MPRQRTDSFYLRHNRIPLALLSSVGSPPRGIAPESLRGKLQRQRPPLYAFSERISSLFPTRSRILNL